jgi:ABC-type enterobactin transport system permease subunit
MDYQTLGEVTAGGAIATAIYLGDGKPWRRALVLTIGLPVTLIAIITGALVNDSPASGWRWIMGQ